MVDSQAAPLTSVAIEWLPYASAAHVTEWMPRLRQVPSGDPKGGVELVLLLLRLSDLENAHPEQQVAGVALATSILQQFARDLAAYCDADARHPPLVVLVTPSPPAQQQKFKDAERELRKRVKSELISRSLTTDRVRWVASTHLQELFYQYNGRDAAFYDSVADRLKHAPYTQRMLNALSFALCRQICRVVPRPQPSTTKKVIVLDCDNTLWGGTVAEMGAHGVALTAPFLSLQRFVLQQQQRGMLLCLCSKNIERDVLQVFDERRDEMVLQMDEHVARSKINWQDKSRNIEELAQELSLGLDAFVFIDDNPVECSEVASKLPMVSVIPVPTGFAPSVLEHEWVFDEPIRSGGEGLMTPTQEDAARTKLYQQNAQRDALMRSSGSHKAFLSSLGVKIVFEQVVLSSSDGGTTTGAADGAASSSQAFARVLQLHQRTNQFNIATSFSRMLSKGVLAGYATHPTSDAVCAHVTDRFGHYGLVSVVLSRLVDSESDMGLADSSIESTSQRSGRELCVDSFLLSCRALNRGVEHAMIRRVAEMAEALGAERISFSWEPTDRNEPARLFFASFPDFSFKPARSSKRSIDESSRVVTTRAEKLQLSSKCKGMWQIATVRAAGVAFLKADVNEVNREVTEAQDVVDSQVLSYSPGAWTALVSRAMATLIRVLRGFLVKIAARVLPRWLLPFIASWRSGEAEAKATASSAQRHRKLLVESFRNANSLNAFIAKHTSLPLDDVTAEEGQDTSVDGQEASKFRRKARHQTKLALLTHMNDDNPGVIWSANRIVDSSKVNGDEINSGTHVSDAGLEDNSDDVLVIQHQQICATPMCNSSIQLQSTCEFQRCRTCCYKIQRLITRLRANAHATARQTAIDTLAEQFGVQVRDAEASSVCPVHQNERRRR